MISSHGTQDISVIHRECRQLMEGTDRPSTYILLPHLAAEVKVVESLVSIES